MDKALHRHLRTDNTMAKKNGQSTTQISKDRHYNGQNKMDKALHRHLRTDHTMAKIKWTKHYTDI